VKICSEIMILQMLPALIIRENVRTDNYMVIVFLARGNSRKNLFSLINTSLRRVQQNRAKQDGSPRRVSQGRCPYVNRSCGKLIDDYLNISSAQKYIIWNK